VGAEDPHMSGFAVTFSEKKNTFCLCAEFPEAKPFSNAATIMTKPRTQQGVWVASFPASQQGMVSRLYKT
jgi:hypothetical protein